MQTLLNFFYMHGYGNYVFTAYGSVLIFLIIQWFFPWQRWRRYLRQQKNNLSTKT
ncbi:MAG: heme exporter protein CcmD [Gammaproteobacteria bacterium]|nr:heme exporter protein CcmD [Gammaproteobacteria bacterium]